MKRIIVLLNLLIPIVVYSQQSNGVTFTYLDSWENVLKMARAKNKYIFVDAYTTWCGPCKMMDKAVYTNAEVGNLLNQDFISIKVQMDTTANDNEQVKSWYRDAKTIAKEAKIEAYPSFLFYTADGELIYKSIGYQNPEVFISMVRFASNPERINFRKQLLDYQNGVRDYVNMGSLAVGTREMAGDYTLAIKIARDYKENYLDKLSLENFLKKENILFIHNNGGGDIVNSHDLFFKTSYEHPEIIDSIIGKGLAKQYVWYVIANEMVTNRLIKDRKPFTENPNWNKIKSLVKTKYPEVNINEFILNQKVSFYKFINNWDQYTRYKTEELKNAIANGIKINPFFELNVPAWDVFKNSNDKNALERALEWSNMSIELTEVGDFPIQQLDTKANLLYKLGRVKEAIASEQQAILFSKEEAKRSNKEKPDFIDEFESNIEKMKRGEATWPQNHN